MVMVSTRCPPSADWLSSMLYMFSIFCCCICILFSAGRGQAVAHSHQLNERWRFLVGAGVGLGGVGTLASPSSRWHEPHPRATQASPPPILTSPAPTGHPFLSPFQPILFLSWCIWVPWLAIRPTCVI